MAHDVFVSYSTKDKAVADTIVSVLESNDIRCWYAPRDIKPSADWAASITKAIKESKVMLLIFSGHSNRSQRVLDELNYAISNELTILPFRIENLEPTDAMMLHLSSRHWLDAYDPSWEDHIEIMLKSVASNLEAPPLTGDLKFPKRKESKGKGKKKKTGMIFAGIVIGAILLTGGGYSISKLMGGSQINTTTAVAENSSPATPTSTTAPTSTSTVQPTSTTEPTSEETGPPLGSAENPIIWMYVPYQGGDFTEISDALAQVAAGFETWSDGLILKPIPAPDSTALVNALCEGNAHIAALSTFAYLAASERDCAEANLIWNAYFGITYGGMIVVRADSGIAEISDLAGKSLCVPDFTSTSGWILPFLEIRASGFEPDTYFGEIIEVGNHLDVVSEVYNGSCDAGSAYYDVRENVEIADVFDKTMIIAQTVPFPNQNISFSPAINTAVERALIGFFLEMAGQEDKLALLIKYTGYDSEQNGLIEINDYYYDQIRDLFERSGENIEDYIGK